MKMKLIGKDFNYLQETIGSEAKRSEFSEKRYH